MTSKKTIEKSKLIKLLTTFSALEWKRFGRFVQSPYHNTNQQLISLYAILKKTFPFEDSKALEQERIYKKIYGQEIFKLSKFQNLCSDLYELVSDFIIDVHLYKEKRKKKKLLIDALSERNYELFKGEAHKLSKEIEEQIYFPDEADFLLLYQLNHELWHHVEKDKFTPLQRELDKTWQYMDSFYELSQIQLKAEGFGRDNIINNEIDSTDANNKQLVLFFNAAAELHQFKNKDKYFSLKRQVLENWAQLKDKHQTNLLLHLINFSFTNELLVKEFGYTELFSLYQLGVKNQLFVINGKMRDTEFYNICMIGFNLKETDWTKSFIQSHQQYLPKKTRAFLVPLANAYNALFQNNYELVIDLLSKLNPINNLGYLNRIKRILIRAYFEGVMKGKEEYIRPLTYEIDSMKKMITRDKKLAVTKLQAAMNFLNLTKKLLHLHIYEPVTNAQFSAFEKQMNSTNPLILRNWLQEKLKEIANAANIK